MRQQLMGRFVPSDMMTAVQAIKRAGGRVFMVVGDAMLDGCSNCNGNGYLHLQTVVGGPFDYVPMSISNNKTHTIPTNIDNKWYQVKLKGFECPVCGGEQLVSELDESIKNSHLDALTKDMTMKSSYRDGQRQREQQGWNQDEQF